MCLYRQSDNVDDVCETPSLTYRVFTVRLKKSKSQFQLDNANTRMIIYSYKSIAYIMGKHARRAQLKIKCTSTKFCNCNYGIELSHFYALIKPEQ